MEVQPVAGGSPGARARTLAAVSVPSIVLVLIVAAGVLGPRGSDTGTAAGSPAPSGTVLPTPASTASRGPSVISAGLLAYAMDATFPRRAVGLPVWSVKATLDLARAGALEQRLVAVGGWLTIPADQASCPTGSPRSADGQDLCLRRGTLADSTDPLARIGSWFPAGISLSGSPRGGGSTLDAVDTPIRVVMLGGFGDPRSGACPPRDVLCANAFFVERPIWVDERWLGRPSLVAGDVGEPMTNEPVGARIAQIALGNSPTILSSALVGRDLLSQIDPIADEEVPATVAGPLWYMRVMPERLSPDVRGRDVRWIVIDAETAAVLASHPATTAPQ